MVKAEVHSPLKSKLCHKFGSLTRMSVASCVFYVSYTAWYITSKLLKLPVGVTFKAWFTEVLRFPFCTVYIKKKKNQDIWARDMIYVSPLNWLIIYFSTYQAFLCISLYCFFGKPLQFTIYILWYFPLKDFCLCNFS
jgi:hypothetical protein